MKTSRVSDTDVVSISVRPASRRSPFNTRTPGHENMSLHGIKKAYIKALKSNCSFCPPFLTLNTARLNIAAMQDVIYPYDAIIWLCILAVQRPTEQNWRMSDWLKWRKASDNVLHFKSFFTARCVFNSQVQSFLLRGIGKKGHWDARHSCMTPSITFCESVRKNNWVSGRKTNGAVTRRRILLGGEKCWLVLESRSSCLITK